MKTKQEAADYLGVTVRSIEAYAAKGKLTPAKAKGTRGDIAVYDEQELEKLKTEREQIIYIERPKPDALATDGVGSTALAKRKDLTDFIRLIETARAAQPTITDLAAKPLLTRAEAQRYTGLSRELLRKAVKTGKLKEILLGRAYRIKTEDLNAYIKKL